MREAKKYKAPDFQQMIQSQKKAEQSSTTLPNGTFVYAHPGKSRKGSFARGFKLTDARYVYTNSYLCNHIQMFFLVYV
jgi:hypothetical protein